MQRRRRRRRIDLEISVVAHARHSMAWHYPQIDSSQLGSKGTFWIVPSPPKLVLFLPNNVKHLTPSPPKLILYLRRIVTLPPPTPPSPCSGDLPGWLQ